MRPLRVKCTDLFSGEVVYVNLNQDWLWRTGSFTDNDGNSVRGTMLMPGRSTGMIETRTDAKGEDVRNAVPVYTVVRQTPEELKALERAALDDQMREDLERKRRIEAEFSTPTSVAR